MFEFLTDFESIGGNGGLQGGTNKAIGGNNNINSIIGETPFFVNWSDIVTKVIFGVLLVFTLKWLFK